MNSVHDIWAAVLEELAQHLTPTAIRTWFSDCEPVEIDSCTLVLHTATEFRREIIMGRFVDLIKNALYDIFSTEFNVLMLVGD